jgi:hypothetical protein
VRRVEIGGELPSAAFTEADFAEIRARLSAELEPPAQARVADR